MQTNKNAKIPLIFCCKPSVFSSIVLDGLIKSEQYQVIAIIQSSRIKHANSFFLTDIFALLKISGMRYLLYLFYTTLLHSFVGLFKKNKPVWLLARRAHIPVFATKNINAQKARNYIVELIKSSKSNAGLQTRVICLTAMFNQKISPALLSMPEIDFINMHPGALPSYRGVDPVASALIYGEDSLSVVLHKTVQDFDAGDIIVSASLKVDAEQSLLWHSRELFSLGVSHFIQSIKCNHDGVITAIDKAVPQAKEGSYYSWPTKNQLKKLGRLI